MLACTVPGSTSSLPVGSVGFGCVVFTVTMAASSVALARFAAARWAEKMFQTTKAQGRHGDHGAHAGEAVHVDPGLMGVGVRA